MSSSQMYITSGPQIPNLAAELAHPCRIDWLFVYHTRNSTMEEGLDTFESNLCVDLDTFPFL